MDEQTPQQPIEPNLPPQEIPVEKKTYDKVEHKIKTLRLKGTLTKLPPEIKNEMEDYMCKNSSNATQKYMAEKYGKDYPNLLELQEQAYYQYAKRHKVKLNKELALQKESATPPPEILDVINKITDPDISLQDKRNALTALFNSCEARSKLLQERQTVFIDPSLEALILANRKEQHAILKTVATLNDQLSKDADKDWIGEAETLVQVVLSTIYNTYKLCHTDQSNFSLFNSTLSEAIQTALKSYKTAKENLKKEVN